MRTQGLVVLKPLLLIGIMMFSPLGCQTGLAHQPQGEMREISNDQLQQIANKKFSEGITAGASVMLIGVYCNCSAYCNCSGKGAHSTFALVHITLPDLKHIALCTVLLRAVTMFFCTRRLFALCACAHCPLSPGSFPEAHCFVALCTFLLR